MDTTEPRAYTSPLEPLQQYWGFDSFRGIQLRVIESILSGRDTLALMPTGGGKSLTFQVPALMGEGLCLVITPLISLMKDQVSSLHRRGIPAEAVYSGIGHDAVMRALDNCILGDRKLLYLSPERLQSPLFLSKLPRMKVSLLAVDEAHCISQWGYDFRPAYRAVSGIRKLLPGVPCLALTATATPAVVGDIQRQLLFKEENVLRMSFRRDNLVYVVREAEDKERELLHILHSVPGSAVVYLRSRRGTTALAKELRQAGIPAIDYHAGLTNEDRNLRQRSWQEGETRVMVATNAFGMGIDKGDVRLVVHMAPPSSPEAYFQEAGRAGRDGKRAWAVLLKRRGDTALLRGRLEDAFPPKEYIRKVYDNVASFLQIPLGEGLGVRREFNVEKFCVRFKHWPLPVRGALQVLTAAGYLDFREDEETSSRVLFLLERDELYRIHSLPPERERVLRLLLRACEGVFADYTFINEERLAEELGMERKRFHEILKGLSHQAIIHYIPRRRAPRLTYLTRRLLSQELRLEKEAYEERKEDMRLRLEAMASYMEEKEACRSVTLLRYFGEDDSEPCHRCDNCLNRDKEKDTDAANHAERADGQPEAASTEADREERLRALTHSLHDALLQASQKGRKALQEAFDESVLPRELKKEIVADMVSEGEIQGF